MTKPRGRRPQTDSADTRAQIVRAAQVAFADHGYNAASMQRIAESAGVTVRAIYHYVPSKQALFQAAFDAAFARYAEGVVEHVLRHDDLAGRLHGFLDMYRVLYEHDRELVTFLGVMVAESIAQNRRAAAAEKSGPTGPKVPPPFDGAFGGADAVVAMNQVLVAQAIERGELDPAVGPDAAINLLQTIGMSLGFAAMAEDDTFLPMLDALDALIDGTLIRRP